MKRFVGSRHDITFENAFLCRNMIDKYCLFLREYVTTVKGNMLQCVHHATRKPPIARHTPRGTNESHPPQASPTRLTHRTPHAARHQRGTVYS